MAISRRTPKPSGKTAIPQASVRSSGAHQRQSSPSISSAQRQGVSQQGTPKATSARRSSGALKAAPADSGEVLSGVGQHTPASGARKASSGRRRPAGRSSASLEYTRTEPSGAGRVGKEIGSLKRRGWTLALKFSVFTLAVTILITFLFGVVTIRQMRDVLEDDINDSAKKQALTFALFGKKLMEDPELIKFKEALTNADRVKALEAFKNKKNDAIKEDLKQIRVLDPDIMDVAIFASEYATPTPKIPILRGDPEVTNFTVQPKNSEVVAGVNIYRGAYGGKACVYASTPIFQNKDGIYVVAKVVLSAYEIDAKIHHEIARLVLIGLLFVGAGVVLSFGIGSWFSKPINLLVDDIDTVAKGNLDHESSVQNQTNDEIGLLAMAFNRMTCNLRTARENERESERLTGELNAAKAIHSKLMPDKLPQIPGIDIFTAYQCAKEVGGDYYDFIPVGDSEHLAFCVADVSGKGIPGSMVMGTTRTILRMMAVNNLSASDVLLKTNYHVARDIKRGMFVTCVYAILNIRTLEMTVASAGHNPMLIWRSATQSIEKIRPGGIALGFDKGPVFNRTIQEQNVRLYAGDRVVLYTDGIVEAMNEQRDEWSDEALDQFTLTNATLPSKEYVRLLIEALEVHKGNAEQHDDITVTTFRIA